MKSREILKRWGAVLELPDAAARRRVGERFAWQVMALPDCRGEELEALSWGLYEAGSADTDLHTALLQQCAARLRARQRRVYVTHVSRVLWVCAQLRAGDQQLYHTVAAEYLRIGSAWARNGDVAAAAATTTTPPGPGGIMASTDATDVQTLMDDVAVAPQGGSPAVSEGAGADTDGAPSTMSTGRSTAVLLESLAHLSYLDTPLCHALAEQVMRCPSLQRDGTAEGAADTVRVMNVVAKLWRARVGGQRTAAAGSTAPRTSRGPTGDAGSIDVDVDPRMLQYLLALTERCLIDRPWCLKAMPAAHIARVVEILANVPACDVAQQQLRREAVLPAVLRQGMVDDKIFVAAGEGHAAPAGGEVIPAARIALHACIALHESRGGTNGNLVAIVTSLVRRTLAQVKRRRDAALTIDSRPSPASTGADGTGGSNSGTVAPAIDAPLLTSLGDLFLAVTYANIDVHKHMARVVREVERCFHYDAGSAAAADGEAPPDTTPTAHSEDASTPTRNAMIYAAAALYAYAARRKYEDTAARALAYLLKAVPTGVAVDAPPPSGAACSPRSGGSGSGGGLATLAQALEGTRHPARVWLLCTVARVLNDSGRRDAARGVLAGVVHAAAAREAALGFRNGWHALGVGDIALCVTVVTDVVKPQLRAMGEAGVGSSGEERHPRCVIARDDAATSSGALLRLFSDGWVAAAGARLMDASSGLPRCRDVSRLMRGVAELQAAAGVLCGDPDHDHDHPPSSQHEAHAGTPPPGMNNARDPPQARSAPTRSERSLAPFAALLDQTVRLYHAEHRWFEPDATDLKMLLTAGAMMQAAHGGVLDVVRELVAPGDSSSSRGATASPWIQHITSAQAHGIAVALCRLRRLPDAAALLRVDGIARRYTPTAAQAAALLRAASVGWRAGAPGDASVPPPSLAPIFNPTGKGLPTPAAFAAASTETLFMVVAAYARVGLRAPVPLLDAAAAALVGRRMPQEHAVRLVAVLTEVGHEGHPAVGYLSTLGRRGPPRASHA